MIVSVQVLLGARGETRLVKAVTVTELCHYHHASQGTLIADA